ncbi:MAG: hypothetical protein WDO74_35000 [Pseudomonadota bacterium]
MWGRGGQSRALVIASSFVHLLAACDDGDATRPALPTMPAAWQKGSISATKACIVR